MRADKKILGLVTLLMMFCQAGLARQVTVSAGGSISSIQQGIDKANTGDTLIIKEGIYREYNIRVDKPMTIYGEGTVVIDGEHQGFVIVITADNVTLQNITVKHASTSFMEDYAAILVKETDGVVIENTTLVDNFFGIYLAKSSKALIKNNHITASGVRETKSGNGIHLWYSKDVNIQNNYVQGHRDGLYFEFVEEARISGNLSEENIRYGIHFMYSDNCRYEKNTFRDNGGGVAVMYTENVEILDNRFEDNWGSSAYGILLKEINRSRIESNLFVNNSVGLYIESTNNNEFIGNTFKQNGWGIELMANSTDNQFTQNNFLDNAFEVSTNSRQSFNEFKHNYWSQYKGYDLDRDGTGDVPHHPVRLFSILVEKQPQALLLLRSLLIDILDAAEKIMPVLTPEALIDSEPQMTKIL